MFFYECGFKSGKMEGMSQKVQIENFLSWFSYA